jgi:hypothetical protein
MKVTQDAAGLVKLVNVRSPLGQQASAKITNTRIANVYQTLAKGLIPPGAQSFSTTGQSIFVEHNMVATKPPVVSGAAPTYLPIQCRVEFRLPNDSYLVETDILDILQATLALILDSDGNTRVLEMMRGVLVSD